MKTSKNRWGAVLVVLAGTSMLHAAPAAGPLRVLRSNPRYFTDGSGRAIYLTGSHTWCNLATDQGKCDPPAEFDFRVYLDFLAGGAETFTRNVSEATPVPSEQHNSSRYSPGMAKRTLVVGA